MLEDRTLNDVLVVVVGAGVNLLLPIVRVRGTKDVLGRGRRGGRDMAGDIERSSSLFLSITNKKHGEIQVSSTR